MSTYGLPDDLNNGWSSGVDGAENLNAYFKKVSARPYQAPSLKSYYASRDTTASERGATTTAQAYQPPGPPIRFTANILDEIAGPKGLNSPLGVAAGLGLPETRGGTADFMGAPIKTVPINAQNVATYFREAPLSVVTSFLGQHYQKPTGDNPWAPPEGLAGNNNNIFENIGKGNFPGILDNIIDGVGVAADKIVAPFTAFAQWDRNDAASHRAEGVAELLRTGHGTQSVVQSLTHILDINSLTDLTRIRAAAAAKGMTDTQMIAEMWELSEAVVLEIQRNPNLSHDEAFKLTEKEPYSYRDMENLIGELGINLVPMLFGAGELRGIGLAARALRGGETIASLGGTVRGTGFIGNVISEAVGVSRATKFKAAADSLGMWSMPNAWRYIRPVLKGAAAVGGVSPTAYKIGGAIRVGEWLFGQAGALTGNQSMIDIADRWLYETPLSDNPGLQMADAFLVHPGRAAKKIYTAARAEAIIRVVGHGDVPVAPGTIAALSTIKTLPLADLQTRLLDQLGFDAGVVKGLFENDKSELTSTDLKNALFHVALSAVRERHPEARIIPAGGIVARSVEFVRRYGDEAARLMRDELNGRGTVIRDAIKNEFWTRIRTAEASELGGLGSIGPYDPHTALIHMVSWIRASKFFQKAFGDDYVPALRTDVNTAFIAQFRTDILAKYGPTDLVSSGDLNRLGTFVPAAKTRTFGAKGKALLRPQSRTPKIKRTELEGILNDLEAVQRESDVSLAMPRADRVPALSPADAQNPVAIANAFNLRADTVQALITASRDGPEALGPLPGDLATLLRRAFRMNADEIKRDPQAAWTKAIGWFDAALDNAVRRGAGADVIGRFTRRLAASMGEKDAVVARAALDRVAHGLVNPHALVDLKGTPLPANIAALITNREALSAELVDRAGAWLEDPRSSMVARDAGDGPLLETAGFTAPMGEHIRILADKVLATDAHAPDPALNSADRAMLADPTTHPIELAGILQRVTGEDRLSKLDQAFIRNRPGDFETAYANEFALTRDGDPTPITRAMVEKLTKEVGAQAVERDALVALARDLALVVDHDPRATMLPDIADWLDRADQLGTTRIGVDRSKNSVIAGWRGLPVDIAAVEAADNSAEIARGIKAIETRVTNLKNDLIVVARAREVASDRINTPLGVDDFTWAETPDKTFTRKADAQSHATLMADAGVPQRVAAVVGPRGGKQWGVFRGELKARPEGLTPAEVEALKVEVGAARDVMYSRARRASFEATLTEAERAAMAQTGELTPEVRLAQMGIDEKWRAVVQADPELLRILNERERGTPAEQQEAIDNLNRLARENYAAAATARAPGDAAFGAALTPDRPEGLITPDEAGILSLPDAERTAGQKHVLHNMNLRLLSRNDEATATQALDVGLITPEEAAVLRNPEDRAAYQSIHDRLRAQGFEPTLQALSPDEVQSINNLHAEVAKMRAEEPPPPAPVIVERLAEPERIAQAKEDAYAAAAAERQDAFAAHAAAFPEKVLVPHAPAAVEAAPASALRVRGRPDSRITVTQLRKQLGDTEVERLALEHPERFSQASTGSKDAKITKGAVKFANGTRGDYYQEPSVTTRPAPVEVPFLDPMDNVTPIRSHVVVVDANDVLTSADEAYPSVFQPRSRELRVESDKQIAEIAKNLQPSKLFGVAEGDVGTPILSPDGFVVSGNGRTQGIRLASEPVYQGYKEALKVEAAKYGFDPAILDTMDRPVLFRQLEGVDPVAMRRLTWQLNGKGFPVGDLAIAFADEVTIANLDTLKIAEKQDLREAIAAEKNKAWSAAILDKVPPDWRNLYFAPDGSPSEQGVKLIEGAIFAKLMRADVPGPHQDAARSLVLALETGSGEVRVVFNGVYSAAAAMLRAQRRADASGAMGKQYLATIDTLSEALSEILRRRRADRSMGDIAVDLQTIDAFAEFTVPAQVGHLGALLASSTQAEIGTFLRGASNATERNVSRGMFEAEAPVTSTGLLNSGVLAWNASRRAANKTEFDNFPSGDPPYDTALTPPRDLPDGNVAPPIRMSQPLLPDDIPGDLAARTFGQPVRVEAETLRDARGATESAGSLTPRDPGELAFLEAYRADPEGVRLDVTDAFDAASRFTDAKTRHDYLKALIASANNGTIEPGDWAVLREIIHPLRRNTRGRINNVTLAQLAQTDWAARMVHGLRESLDDLDAVTRLGETDPSQTRLVRLSAQRALSEAELHAVTGPEVRHAPIDPIAEDLATTSEHTITTNENPTVEAAVRKARGGARTVSGGTRRLEFNAPTGKAQVDRLAAIEQAKRSHLEAAEQELANARTNPPLNPTTPRGSVFVDPQGAALWDRLMRSGLDQAAEGLGSAEPRFLPEVIDVVQSIDRGALGDPITGVSITPAEAVTLRGQLMRIAESSLQSAMDKVGAGKARRRTRRVRPDDFDADGNASAMDALVNEISPLISSDPSVPKLDGFAGTQYFPSPPTGATAETGAITPRLPFHDWLGSDLVPGLEEELASGRMMDIDERIRRSRVLSVIEHVLGPRSQKEITANAVGLFRSEVERQLGGGLSSAEAEALDKAIDATFEAWRSAVEEAVIHPFKFSIYRRIDLMGPARLNKMAHAAFEEHYPDGLAVLGGKDFNIDPIWRRADNRLRQFLISHDSPFGLSHAIEKYYGKVADSGFGTAGRFVTVLYHLARFTAELRWLALEVTEPIALGVFHGGMGPLIEAQSKVAPRAPFGFGQLGQSNFFANYAHWGRTSDVEQVTPLRQRVIVRSLAQRQERPFVETVLQMLNEDPQLKRLMVDLGDTPHQFIQRLDRDYQLLELGGRKLAPDEASVFFKRWLDAGIIDKGTYDAYVKGGVYHADARIEAELARASSPVAHALYTRLAQVNHDLLHDLTATFFGQENRSNLQRVLNHPLLYWPISYQIKATKWLIRFMTEEAFGVDAGMLPALALERVYLEHKRRMRDDPRYAADLKANNTLYFLASMFLPIAPWDIGVSLSPWSRMALSWSGAGPDYSRQFGILGFGLYSTYNLAARLIAEKIPAASPILPVMYGSRGKPTSRAEEATQLVVGPNDIPYVYPEVPRLP